MEPDTSLKATTEVQSEILFTSELIQKRINKICDEIFEYYKKLGVIPVIVGVLTGGAFFAMELAKRLFKLGLNCPIRFVSTARYIDNGIANPVAQVGSLPTGISGKYILLSEDIVEEGISMQCLHREISRMPNPPKSIQIAVVIDKKGHGDLGFPLDYILFPDVDKEDWLFGFGMDDNGYYRPDENIRKKRL